MKTCSEECWEDLRELAARADERSRLVWCPECGYDNFEHGPACPKADVGPAAAVGP